MGRTGGGGVDGVKNRSGKWEGLAGGGGSTGYITHLCIMHGAHTSFMYCSGDALYQLCLKQYIRIELYAWGSRTVSHIMYKPE